MRQLKLKGCVSYQQSGSNGKGVSPLSKQFLPRTRAETAGQYVWAQTVSVLGGGFSVSLSISQVKKMHLCVDG